MSSDRHPQSSLPTPTIQTLSLPSPHATSPIPPSASSPSQTSHSKPLKLAHHVSWTPCLSPPYITPLEQDMFFLPNATRETLLPFLESLLRQKGSGRAGGGGGNGEGKGKIAIPWQCLMQLWINDGRTDVVLALAALRRLGIGELVLVLGKGDVLEAVKGGREVEDGKRVGEKGERFVFVRPGRDRGEICRDEGFVTGDFAWEVFLAMVGLWPGEERDWEDLEGGVEEGIRGVKGEVVERWGAVTEGVVEDKVLEGIVWDRVLDGCEGWEKVRVRFMEIRKV
ncbi:hypothetical protein EG329_013823 [Mollisiaceae sp. DMI_Dod_QoI]|nr:hypothetical protein EG329_013823 [Helotiales sp. DMI_Dod_QoI]